MATAVFNKESIDYGEIVTLETVICCNCGVPFAMPANLKRRFHETQDSFYCPNGHPQHYTKSTEQILREKLQAQQQNHERESENLRTQRDNAIKERTALKGKLTKVKNRIKNGVCPCCNRTFQNLSNHMKTQHPEFNVQTPHPPFSKKAGE